MFIYSIRKVYRKLGEYYISLMADEDGEALFFLLTSGGGVDDILCQTRGDMLEDMEQYFEEPEKYVLSYDIKGKFPLIYKVLYQELELSVSSDTLGHIS